jgi:gliding motility-associated-like protein
MTRILSFLSIIFISFFSVNLSAQISGTVFIDYNGDGIWQNATEPPASGIIIDAYNASNTLLNTTTSAANGTYTLPFTVAVRIEFVIGKNVCQDSTFYYNVVEPNGNNVRFINASTTNVDFGINNTTEFDLQSNPLCFVPKFNRGDPLVPGASAASFSYVAYPYNTVGAPGPPYVPPYQLTSDKVGSLWGVAFNKKSKQTFAGAFLKRITGLGPLGSGGIYKIDTNNAGGFDVIQFYDMDANGHRTRAASTAVAYGLGTSFSLNGAGTIATYLGPIDLETNLPEGFGVIGTNAQRGLSGGGGGSINDAAAFDQVCKVGIGDMEFSDDGKFLFLMNLYDRKLYRLEMDNAFDPQLVIEVKKYELPALVLNNGKMRGFAVNYHNNKIYVGAVSTGEDAGTITVNGPTDVTAYLFEMYDPTGNAIFKPTPIHSIPLNYRKGYAINGNAGTDRWYPWNANTSVLINLGEESLPVPVFSNLAFTDAGDLIIDLMDRSGHQHGNGTYQNLTGSNMIGSYDVGGDLLVAGYNCATDTFVTENNGSYTSQGTTLNSTLGVGNTEGIGGGEFFEGDVWGSGFHAETSVGSLTKIPRRGEFIATNMDPIDAFSNGTQKFSISNGTSYGDITLANTTQFGKANSLGDLEVVGDCLPLHTGNRVWTDNNGNGIQDADENGIANVNLELYADFNRDNIPDGAMIATTITDANGVYYFNESNVTDGDPITAGNQKGLSSHTQYIIRVAASDWNGILGINDLAGLLPTLLDVGGNIGQANVRDNDAEIVAAQIQMIVRLRMNGKNDFNNDMGFSPCVPIGLNNVDIGCSKTSVIIGPTNAGNAITFFWQPPFGLSNVNVMQPTASPLTTTIYTLTIDGNCKQTVTVNVNIVVPPVDPGLPQTITCVTNINGVLIGTPAVLGYTYLWSPTIGLANATDAQTIANPNTTTIYTLTVSDINSCENKSNVTVTVDKCCTRLTVPNSFTPNNDGLNDEIGVIEIENLKDFNFQIFNRFGEKVFMCVNNKNLKWDGKLNGKKCDYGTYFYQLIYDCKAKGEKQIRKGDISLLP